MPIVNEFDGRLKWVASEWKSQTDELAAWAMERLVNRRDVWGQYTLKPDGDVGVFTLPVKERRGAGSDMVTLNKLRRHFSGTAVSHLIGLHAASDQGSCKWFAVDVDLHNETIVNSDEQALANLAACLAWCKELRKHFMDPCLIDSNGVGGFHLLVLLDRAYPAADVYKFVSSLRIGFEKHGLPKKPEIFPSKPETGGDKLGNWLRLPGRHHSRGHFSRIWNFDKEGEWLEGADAVEALLSLRTAALPQLCAKPAKETRPRRAASVYRKPRVCVDLDRVLAKYDEWQGQRDQIGPPIPGALNFMHELAKIADIAIFTSRCSLDNGGDEPRRISPGKL